MSRTLEICTLDGLTITYDREPVVALGSHKAEALLVYLVRTRRSYPRQVLAEFFWPDRPQTQSLANLRRELMALRQQLDACINITRDAVEMDSSAACWLDVAEFERNLATVDQASTPAGTLASASVSQLEAALALYRGDFLDGFYVDSPAFEDWARLEREQLQFRVLDLLDTLVMHATTEHDYSAGIAYATRLLQMDSLRELTHRQLMLLLAQSGQREAALAQYETCRRLLADELGVEPTAETTTLYEQIRSGTAMSDSSKPRRLRGYELRERIGTGGFGEVYRAYQPAVGREVAIKVILPQYANEPDFIRRFEAEAQLIARLEHPFIVPLYDYWREPGGAYLVMRCLRESLRDRLQRGPLSLDEATRLVDQIASALAAAHRQHVIHRDLKPANILLDDEGNSYLADFGIAKGPLVSLEATQAGRVVGSPAYLSPEQIRSEPVTPGADIYSFGVMLYEMLTGQHPFPPDLTPTALLYKHLSEPIPSLRPVRSDLPMALDEVIQRATAKDFARRYPDTLSLAAAFRRAAMPEHGAAPGEPTILGMPGVALETGEPTWTLAAPRNPYKGLRAFEQADAADFFGRQALIDQLLARLGDGDYHRFLAVVGPSGCGKSSVVKAGIIPALRAGKLPGSDQWFVAETLPGSHPLEELELALIRIAAAPGLNLLPLLREDERGLLRAVRHILPDKATLLLVIDQFEEVFTLVQDDAERVFFLNCLLAAVTDPRSPLRVVIALRADFTDRPLLHPDFGDLLRRRIEFVLPMTADELNQAITAPAEHVGVHLAPDLLAALVKDVHDEPGILPLLQYAMTEVFERREGQTLTLAGYQAVGGVLGALAQRADGVYARLDGPQQALAQQVAQQVFLRLITLGEGIEDTRRRTRQSELRAVAASVSDPGTLQTVLDTFGKGRLLTFDRDPLTREPTVEVAHEALIREWQRLRTWLDESRSDIRQQRMLAVAAQEWRSADQDRSYLLTGSRLTQFSDWATATHVALTPDERACLGASTTECERQAAAERERQAHEAVLKQRVQRMILLLAVVFLVAAVVSSGLAIFAFDREEQAQVARARAERTSSVNNSVRIDGQAQSLVTAGNPDLALVLALEAAKIDQPPSDVIGALANSALGIGTRYVIKAHDYSVKDVALGPDEKQALSGSCQAMQGTTCTAGEMILWDLDTKTVRRRFAGHTDWVNSVAFSPDGQSVLSGSGDGTVILWDERTGAVIHRFQGHKDGVNSAVFSPDGQQILSGSADTTLILWDVKTGQIIRRFEGHRGAVNSVAFSPDGQQAVSGSADATSMVWDVKTGQVVHHLEGHIDVVNGVAFSPDGKWILTVDQGSYLRVYNAGTGKENLDMPQHKYGNPLTDLSVSAAGHALFGITTGCNLLDAGSLQDIGSGFVGDYLYKTWSVAISASGRVGLVGTTDGVLAVLNLDGQAEMRRFGAGIPYFGLAVSPDGRYLLTGAGQGGQAILWNLATGTEIRRFQDNNNYIFDLTFSPDSRYALLAASDFGGNPDTPSHVVLWDVETGQEVRRFEKGLTGWIISVAFSPDGRQMFSSSVSMVPDRIPGGLLLWDVATGQLIRRFTAESTGRVVFSADGKQALSGTYFNVGAYMSLWDVATGQEIHRFAGGYDPRETSFSVAFGPGEKTAMSSSTDGTLVVWDIHTGKIFRRFTGADSSFWSPISVSRDGRYVLSGSFRDVLLWDFETGDVLRHFHGNTNWVAVVFGPDDQTAFSVANGPADGITEWQIANWSLDKLIAWTHTNRYVRELTCDERQRYRIEPLCKAGEQ